MNGASLKTIGIIPARGGSKGIKNKNLIPLLDKPLIAYSILSARKSKLLTRVIVSTDSPEIAKVAREYGAEVPFLRPAEFATDTALSIDVVKHALLELKKTEGVEYDAVVLLQPTTPLRRGTDIDQAIIKLRESGCDSVVSFVDVGAHHPARMYTIENERLQSVMEEKVTMRPRQELPPVYIRSGDIYAARVETVFSQGTLMGKNTRPFILSENRSLNIDSPYDLVRAEYLLKLEREVSAP